MVRKYKSSNTLFSSYYGINFMIAIIRSIVAPFTAANGMLTPKMSIRRHKVIQFYDDIIDRMYNDGRLSSDVDYELNHRNVS